MCSLTKYIWALTQEKGVQQWMQSQSNQEGQEVFLIQGDLCWARGYHCVLFLLLVKTLLSHTRVQLPFTLRQVEYHVDFASLSDLAVSANSFLLPFIGRCNPDEIQLCLSSTVLIMQCHLLPSKQEPPSLLSDFTCCGGRCSSNCISHVPNLLAPNTYL